MIKIVFSSQTRKFLFCQYSLTIHAILKTNESMLKDIFVVVHQQVRDKGENSHEEFEPLAKSHVCHIWNINSHSHTNGKWKPSTHWAECFATNVLFYSVASILVWWWNTMGFMAVGAILKSQLRANKWFN